MSDNIISERLMKLCSKITEQHQEIQRLRQALQRIRDCDWVITLPDRMDAVRQIAREALE